MKPKRMAALLTAAVMLLALCMPVAAEEWKGEDYAVSVPEEFVYTFTPAVSAEDPSWALAGITDPSSKLEEYRDMNITADFYTEEGGAGTSIKMQARSSSTTESIFHLRDMDEEAKASFLDQLIQSQSEDISVQKEYVDVNGYPFYRIQIDGIIEGSEVHEIQYGTIFNGHTLAFILNSGEAEPTAEQLSLLEEMVNSVQITQFLERPEPEPVNVALILGLLVLLVGIVAAPIVYLPIRNKREKKRKAQMAEQLGEFHRTHSGDTLSGELYFVNETECTKEAIHTFSLYHAYQKNLVSLLMGLGLSAATLLAVFLFDMVWWMKLLAVGVTVYYIYRAISMPGAVEKIQRKVFGRGVSSTARYTFYEDGFRVSGIQSASVFPYFQITSIRRHGHYLYLYYGPDNAYLVDQYGFSLGEFEDFAKFIREKAGK